jgi:hypothetical protein
MREIYCSFLKKIGAAKPYLLQTPYLVTPDLLMDSLKPAPQNQYTNLLLLVI